MVEEVVSLYELVPSWLHRVRAFSQNIESLVKFLTLGKYLQLHFNSGKSSVFQFLAERASEKKKSASIRIAFGDYRMTVAGKPKATSGN